MTSAFNTSVPDVRPAPLFPSEPALFEWILLRRSLAFCLDATLILLFTVSAYLLVILLGVVTLGLSWLFLGLVFPAVALGYYSLSLGLRGATLGMNALGLSMITGNGEPVGAARAVAHALLFWISVVMLTPLSLIIGIFTDRRRLLHDIVLDCTLINANVRPPSK